MKKKSAKQAAKAALPQNLKDALDSLNNAKVAFFMKQDAAAMNWVDKAIDQIERTESPCTPTESAQ